MCIVPTTLFDSTHWKLSYTVKICPGKQIKANQNGLIDFVLHFNKETFYWKDLENEKFSIPLANMYRISLQVKLVFQEIAA